MVSPELAHLAILAINLAKAFDSDSRLSWMDTTRTKKIALRVAELTCFLGRQRVLNWPRSQICSEHNHIRHTAKANHANPGKASDKRQENHIANKKHYERKGRMTPSSVSRIAGAIPHTESTRNDRAKSDVARKTSRLLNLSPIRVKQ